MSVPRAAWFTSFRQVGPVGIGAGRDLACLLRPRAVDNLPKAAPLVWGQSWR